MDCLVPEILQVRTLEWVAYPFSGIFPTQESNRGLLHCGQILYQLSYQGNPSCKLVLINFKDENEISIHSILCVDLETHPFESVLKVIL